MLPERRNSGLQLKYKTVLAAAPALILLDQVSKTVMRDVLAFGHEIVLVPGFLHFQYAGNSGMAFGLLQNLPEAWRTPFFFAITAVAVLIIAHLFRQAPGHSLRLPLALSFILAGALGNLIDRFRWGSVVDFIKVQVWPPARYYWPTFNLADTFITIGIVLLVLDTILARESENALQASEADAAPAQGQGAGPGQAPDPR
jgi:signal peptidase II